MNISTEEEFNVYNTMISLMILSSGLPDMTEEKVLTIIDTISKVIKEEGMSQLFRRLEAYQISQQEMDQSDID